MRTFALAALLLFVACKSGSGHAASEPGATWKLPGGRADFPAAPLISRGHKPVSKQRNAASLTDGKYRSETWLAGKPTAAAPAAAAFEVGKGPTRLLLVWNSSGNFPYDDTTYGGPGSYRIETSADSDDGEGGTWKTVVTVTDNTVKTRAHAFDFTGQRWVRFVVTGPSPKTFEYGVQLDEIDLHDVSRGAADTWFFLGDSVTAFAFDRAPAHQPSFAELVHQKHPDYFPVMLNGGVGFLKASDGLSRLKDVLALNPDMKHWAIGYGTNDAAGDNRDTASFKQSLTGIIQALVAAGREPVLARIPYAPKEHAHIDAFNAVIDELTVQHKLPKGPDLYAHFKAHPEELADGLHPNDAGIKSINRLWAEAMEPLYAPR